MFGELTADLNHRGDYLENRQRIVLRHTLALGANQQVRLYKFVYDPNKGTGSTVIEADARTFRFSTGAQNRSEVKIKTPYGTLGTRG